MTRRRSLLDLLLGPRCPSCDQRVFPRDEPSHRCVPVKTQVRRKFS